MSHVVELYQKAAREFAQRVVSELNGAIEAVVLYGSVARGTASSRSDVDLLIVSPEKDPIRNKVAEIEVDIDAKNNYQTFLTSAYFTPQELRSLAISGSPYVLDVLNEGVILYDDGFFTGLRQQVLGAGRQDARRRQAYARARTA